MVAVLQPMKQGRLIAVDRAVILVGRGSDCDAVITGSKKISRRHCCVVQVDESYYVRDLGSMNGVWLNGNKVNREAILKSGDCLCIGDVEFLFHPNARVEQKKAVATPVDQPPPPPVDPPQDDALTEDIIQVDDSIEVIDDVIPLDQVELEEEDDSIYVEQDEVLVETNEVEIIDQPIVDPEEGDLDDLDEIIVFDE